MPPPHRRLNGGSALGPSEPMFNLPRSVVAASAVMIGVQVIRSLVPDEQSLELLLALAFIPARYSGAAAELAGGYLAAVTSFVTYMTMKTY